MTSPARPDAAKEARYHGLTYPPGLLKGWRGCKRKQHLFDEVLTSATLDGSPTHYLVCDACNLMVEISRVIKP